MDIQLISGVFTIEEAEELLTAIFNTKIQFHENRIRTIHDREEDIEHSEKRIIQLQETLRGAIRKLRESGKTHTALNAHIEVNTAARLTQ
jgi:chaperonin cofactor prefoldin